MVGRRKPPPPDTPKIESQGTEARPRVLHRQVHRRGHDESMTGELSNREDVDLELQPQQLSEPAPAAPAAPPAPARPAKNRAAKKNVREMLDVNDAIFAIQSDIPTRLPPPVPVAQSTLTCPPSTARAATALGQKQTQRPKKPEKRNKDESHLRLPPASSGVNLDNANEVFMNTDTTLAAGVMDAESGCTDEPFLKHGREVVKVEAVDDVARGTDESDAMINRLTPTDNGNVTAAIYDFHTLNTKWLCAAITAHILQFTWLFILTRNLMRTGDFVALVLLAVFVTLLLLLSRKYVTKHKTRRDDADGSGSGTNTRQHYSDRKRHGAPPAKLLSFCGRTYRERTPAEEADDVKPTAVMLLAGASVCEGTLFAAFTAVLASDASMTSLDTNKQQLLLQVLQFASIVFLLFHQSMRPANRCDPLRSMLELEVVSVCWDALDGATIYELLYQLHSAGNLLADMATALRALLAFWYLSVGCRTAVMLLCHLPANHWGYQLILPAPLSLAAEPVVDRTLQALRNRSVVMITMAIAEMYAGICRLVLWSRGQLSQLQMEMTVKNMAFMYSVYSASDMYSTTEKERRDWNTREIGCGLVWPERKTQLVFFKWLFLVMYLIQGALLSLVLSNVTPASQAHRWQANTGFDVIFAILFWLYCSHCDVKRANNEQGRYWFAPQPSHVIFPKKLGLCLTFLMFVSLLVARTPALYENYPMFLVQTETTSGFYIYDNVLMLVALSIITIGSCAWYWSISYMLFNKEFTAVPGNYNAIHDPTIIMVSTTAQIEGALDVLSAVMLMNLAKENVDKNLQFSPEMQVFIQVFVLLELFNAGLCFVLQVFLAGGTDDTPMHLVKWKAILRSFRAGIDLGTLTLRLVLWIHYGAVSSVFLIKNLYNLIHTVSQIERYIGVGRYPKYTVFTEAPPPSDWYGLSKAEWRKATGNTIALQAQSGRAV